MKLHVYTVYNRVDGSAEQLFCARSSTRFVREFVEGVEARNRQLTEKRYPTINLDEYEIRHVGEFDDETCVLEALPVPSVVPFSTHDD